MSEPLGTVLLSSLGGSVLLVRIAHATHAPGMFDLRVHSRAMHGCPVLKACGGLTNDKEEV